MKSKKNLTWILGALIACCVINTYADDTVAKKGKTPVIYIHDAAIDEFIVPMLLNTMDNVDLKGIIIVDGDAWGFIAAEVQWKLNAIIGLDVPVGISSAEGIHPFPSAYRNDCVAMNQLPILNPTDVKSKWTVWDGQKLLENVLKNSSNPVTILLCCGATPVATVLKDHPEYESKIKEIIWMGGAIDKTGGNVVDMKDQSIRYYCEWNFYWDPTLKENPIFKTVGAQWLMENTSCPIVLFPLDITDKFPLHFNPGTKIVNKDAVKFTDALEKNAKFSLYCDVAYNAYDISLQRAYAGKDSFYCLWDTTTAVYLAHPEFFELEDYRISVTTDNSDPDGLSNPNPDGHITVGQDEVRPIKAAMKLKDGVKPSQVYEYILNQYLTSGKVNSL